MDKQYETVKEYILDRLGDGIGETQDAGAALPASNAAHEARPGNGAPRQLRT